MLSPSRWIVAVCALTVAGWFVFDGVHAVITGDYVTPSSGRFAGQLGPWARLVDLVGIDPRSTLMHVIFIAYGALWLPVIPLYLLKLPLTRLLMLAMAIGALWYIPFGTALCLVQIVLILLPRKIAAA